MWGAVAIISVFCLIHCGIAWNSLRHNRKFDARRRDPEAVDGPLLFGDPNRIWFDLPDGTHGPFRTIGEANEAYRELIR